jgi:tetratricopeptide (TPR) repeat protein
MKSRGTSHIWRLIVAGLLSGAVFVRAEEDPRDALALNIPENVSEGTDPVIRYYGMTNEQTYSKMLVDSSEDPQVRQWNDKGFQALQNGDPKRSLQFFKQAYLLNKKGTRARFGIGTAFISIGRYKDALTVFNPMMEEYPYDFLLKNNVAWLLATANDPTVRNPQRALRIAQDAILTGYKDFHVWSTLSEAYYAVGNYEKALRAAAQALELARDAGAPPGSVEDYQVQVRKCSKAVEAFSILE